MSDSIDSLNVFITATAGESLLGFISITPPEGGRYSLDRYFRREELPFEVDGRLHEVRLLAVDRRHRGWQTASLLMYAAFRWVEARGGARIAAIGRVAILDMYRKTGLEPHGMRVRSGAVDFELLSAPLSRMRRHLARYGPSLARMEAAADWQLGIPFQEEAACYHGGDFFEAIGDGFDHLEKREGIINADVLDAWFPPSPKVLDAIRDHLPWILGTSPPTGCEGLTRAVARARGVDPRSILPGSGSSDLIFLALREWLDEASRVLILDPMYGEYAHLLEKVIGCRVDRLRLSREDGYRLGVRRLEERFEEGHDLIILVNPNSPTGAHAPRESLEPALARAPRRTRIWIDETYSDFAGRDESVDRLASRSDNLMVCKSLSKAYALSGVRAAYLCGPQELIRRLRSISPPWAVSLPGQIAAVKALEDPEYYIGRWRETAELRRGLARGLAAIPGIEIVPGRANFLLCHLPESGPGADAVLASCRRRGLYLRNAASMGSSMGNHAIRIAVKDAAANRRMAVLLREAWEECRSPDGRGPLDLLQFPPA